MSETLRKPRLFWTDMSDPTFTAQNAPWSAAWIATLARNTECHKQALYGEGAFVGDVPHDHTTAETLPLSTPTGQNIVLASCPSVRFGDEFEDLDAPWGGSGWELARPVPPGANPLTDDLRFLEGGVTAGWFAQQLFNHKINNEIMGGGTDLVLSFFACVKDTTTRGMLQVGIASEDNGFAAELDPDGNGVVLESENYAPAESPGDFLAGQSAACHHLDLSTSWKRFYLRILDGGRRARASLRYTVKTAERFDATVNVCGMNLTIGRRLYPWQPSPGDLAKRPVHAGNRGWQNLPSTVPLLDWNVSMTNAVKLVNI